VLSVGRCRRTSTLAALTEVRGPDKVLLWGFASLFSVEAALAVAYAVYPIPSVWVLGDEGSVPTFLHSAILATIALIFWGIFAVGLWDRDRAQVTIKYLPVWFAGGLAFLYLSMDEAMEFHERVSRRVFEYLGIQDRIAHYELTPALWEVVLAPVFVIVGLLILWVLFQERHRIPVAFRLGLAAIGIWALALVTEFFEMTYFIHMGSVGPFNWYGVAIWVEETSEILASTIFLVASALIIRRYFGWGGKEGAAGEL